MHNVHFAGGSEAPDTNEQPEFKMNSSTHLPSVRKMPNPRSSKSAFIKREKKTHYHSMVCIDSMPSSHSVVLDLYP